MKYKLYWGRDKRLFCEFRTKILLKKGDAIVVEKKNTILADHKEVRSWEKDYEPDKRSVDGLGKIYFLTIILSPVYLMGKRGVKEIRLRIENNS